MEKDFRSFNTMLEKFVCRFMRDFIPIQLGDQMNSLTGLEPSEAVHFAIYLDESGLAKTLVRNPDDPHHSIIDVMPTAKAISLVEERIEARKALQSATRLQWILSLVSALLAAGFTAILTIK